ncbi:MAG TPA: hypothetical protein EYO76_04460, partial [Flavobacteriaceae bacterium]|nr:hypothetical protein [Flavobacteriaceae bacterium]
MKQLFYLLIVLVFFACNDKKEQGEITEKAEKVYDMYTPSEMANLMNEMYAYNQQLKKDIIDGKIPTKFPEKFLNIHTAQLSDFKSRNETFKSFSNLYIQAEKEVFNPNSEVPIETRFN